jgi:heme/copper-type cytochrome/quinol oxidase subunit 3
VARVAALTPATVAAARPSTTPRTRGAVLVPFAPPVLGTLFVIAAEVMLFAGLVFAYWVLRLAAPVWPPPFQPRLPIGLTALNTLVLLASSGAMAAALRAGGRADRARLGRGLGGAAVLGGVFLAVQGWEWMRLVGFGLTVGSGPYGALFYTLIGAHALHVGAALAWLARVAFLARRGHAGGSGADALTACALYWHFVVALWPALWVTVYLL